VDTIVNALDKGKLICTAFLGNRKALDSLDHSILLHHLSELGMIGSEHQWFINYLPNCLQQVKIYGEVFSWMAVRGGSCHGSALGWLLLLLYVLLLSLVNFTVCRWHHLNLLQFQY